MDWQAIQPEDLMVAAAILCLLTAPLVIAGGAAITVGQTAGRYLIFLAVPMLLLVIGLMVFGIWLELERL